MNMNYKLISKVIDYRAKAPLHQYLKDQKLDRPFDYILDTVRTQELYDNSPSYLKPKGLYINIGAHGTQWQQLTGRVKGYLVPTWLGGTPRKYMSMGLLPNGKLQREVADWANAGLLKEVPIDSELAMEDVLQVCSSSHRTPTLQSQLTPTLGICQNRESTCEGKSNHSRC